MRPVRALLVSLSFLTRLPIGVMPARPTELGLALGFFPLVGVMLGALLAGTGMLLARGVDSGLLAIGLVTLLALVTGGLHLDGLADVFDGLGGGRGDRERTLAIMRDGRSGPHGVVALVLILMAKVWAIRAALEHDDLVLLVAFPAVARTVAVLLVWGFPYARADGLGSGFKESVGVAHVSMALTVGGAVAWLAGVDPVALAAAWVAPLLLALLLRRRIGGLTGDAYGAAIEIAEVVLLAASHPL